MQEILELVLLPERRQYGNEGRPHRRPEWWHAVSGPAVGNTYPLHLTYFTCCLVYPHPSQAWNGELRTSAPNTPVRSDVDIVAGKGDRGMESRTCCSLIVLSHNPFTYRLTLSVYTYDAIPAPL